MFFNNYRINVDLKGVVYKTGIMFGSEEDWDTVLESYMTENDASEKMKLLAALGWTKDPILMSRYVGYAHPPPLRG